MRSTPLVIEQKLQVIADGVRTFATIMSAYRECAPDVQQIVDEMTSIVADADATKEEKEHALDAIIEALFPGLTADLVEVTKSVGRTEGAKRIKRSLEKEEASFADRLASLIRDRKISQAELARRIGIQQPAISMMLRRQCRPQRNTVLRLADALEVAPEDLWPDLAENK